MNWKSPRQLYAEAIVKRREYMKNIWMEIYRDWYKKWDKKIFFSEIEWDTDENFYKKLEGISSIVIATVSPLSFSNLINFSIIF